MQHVAANMNQVTMGQWLLSCSKRLLNLEVASSVPQRSAEFECKDIPLTIL